MLTRQPDEESPDSGRARPLPPDERRTMLIAATLPLVVEYGPKVTTRQIAQAAGVAEGTIFRVFPDKQALIHAAVAAALDLAPTLTELSRVDAALPLRERLVAMVGILQRRLIQAFRLMMAICIQGPPDAAEQQRRNQTEQAQIQVEVIRLLEPDRDRFRTSLTEVARLMRMLTFAGSHPLISDNHLLTATDITDVLLDGLLRRDTDGPDTDGPDTEHHESDDRGDDPC